MDEVLKPVLSDLQRPRSVDFEIGVQSHRDGDGDLVWFSERGVTGAAGRPVSDPSRPRPELMVEWADWLQEHVFPETQGAWGQARPACPGHGHPAMATELDGKAWWVCPASNRRIGRIGHLK
jgi:hypothetical protein